jgi:hypothetical protein
MVRSIYIVKKHLVHCLISYGSGTFYNVRDITLFSHNRTPTVIF